jgi:lycopene beta-cyclase
MFDFRTPQDGAMRFMYILPFSPTRALVEYTLFSKNLLITGEYDAGLLHYIPDHLHLCNAEYKIVDVEDGIIPMTDYPFIRKLGKHILATGTKGGLIKPSMGYAFLRMQKDRAAIDKSLKQHGHP